MALALAKAKEHGELVRKPGGFWTAEGTPEKKDGTPEWYFSTSTIQGLINRKLLVGAAHLQRGQPWKVKIAGADDSP